MLTLIYVIFTIVCIFLVITVLLQPGKSGGLGAAFGGGGNTVFGASGGTPVFRRMTTGAAICFMVLSLVLAYLSLDKSVTGEEQTKKRGLDFGSTPIEAGELPVIPAPAAPAAAPAPVDVVPAPAAAAPAAPAAAPAPVDVVPAPAAAAPAAPAAPAPAVEAPAAAAPAAAAPAAPAAPAAAAPAAPAPVAEAPAAPAAP